MYIINYIDVSRIGMGTVAEAIATGFLVHLVVNLMVLLIQHFQEVHMVKEVGEEEEEEWGKEKGGEGGGRGEWVGRSSSRRMTIG